MTDLTPQHSQFTDVERAAMHREMMTACNAAKANMLRLEPLAVDAQRFDTFGEATQAAAAWEGIFGRAEFTATIYRVYGPTKWVVRIGAGGVANTIVRGWVAGFTPARDELQELADELAAIQTEEEHGDEGMSGDDACETLTGLIGWARTLSNVVPPEPVKD